MRVLIMKYSDTVMRYEVASVRYEDFLDFEV